MVGISEKLPTLKSRDYMIAGAASGFMTRALFQPLDVLKIRFQLQVEPVRKNSAVSKYRGISHAVRCIFLEEGLPAFWKGHIPAQCLSISYGAFQFVSFELLTSQAKTLLPQCVHKHYKPIINFTCGAAAGCVATVGSFPFDVIRTRLVGQGEPKIYTGILNGFKQMLFMEGPRSFFKGLLPTLIQIAPNAGFQFAFYKFFQDAWTFVFKEYFTEMNTLKNGVCGAAAGIGAKVVVYPLDLIKKRLQVQGFEKARIPFGSVRKYNGWTHCVRSILREERLRGLYKGMSPSIYKAALTTGSHFLFYEEMCKLLRYLY